MNHENKEECYYYEDTHRLQVHNNQPEVFLQYIQGQVEEDYLEGAKNQSL